MSEIKYLHDEEHHNLISPKEIVPQLIRVVNPKSVVDVGCGIGTFLKIFKENGVSDIYGLDGKWTDKNLLSKYLDLSNFQEVDLEDRISLKKKFDLAISLEVAEHISESNAEIFVDNLVNLSEVIVFSAAFPTQGGQNHINEQWPTYWEKKFNRHGYKFHDVIRPLIWNNENIQIWYRQNIFLVIKENCEKDIIKDFVKMNNSVMDIIHPSIYQYYYDRNNEFNILNKKYNDINKGRENLILYIKLFAKWLLRKLNIYTK